ncbi:MAG: glycosyltransferase [Janthinobacterium lividum]
MQHFDSGRRGSSRFAPSRGPVQPQPAETADFLAITRIHQTLIVDGESAAHTISAAAQDSIRSFQQAYPAAMHTLWTKEMLHEFMSQHFGNEVVRAFETLKPYTYKSDLARYCLLYAMGGLYSDIGIQHFAPLHIPREYKIAGFIESYLAKKNKYDISSGFLYAQPKAAVLELAINRIVENCRTRFFGKTAIDPTGPGLLGWAWASVYTDQWSRGAAGDQYLGLSEIVDLVEGKLEMMFLPTGRERHVIARRLARPQGDLRYLGNTGRGNYAQMWRERDIYQ